jgi:hypothetical protein
LHGQPGGKRLGIIVAVIESKNQVAEVPKIEMVFGHMA